MKVENNIPTTMEDISDILKDMKFKHVLVGGVDDADVWKQIEKLDEAYRTILAFQQDECNRQCAILEQKNTILTSKLIRLGKNYNWAYKQLEKLKEELEQMKGGEKS
ncbi:hypothetical protein [Pseudobutyrivibrio ruminis]|uniref:hypothetical protein n=1 Tax=Pseudobutyrivibrio ruminis TaxID=46206 RepID=UPI0004076791|nr:hypothetical protein [Pseudobutyrivibrio ruminis]